jgi:hypothetical protein
MKEDEINGAFSTYGPHTQIQKEILREEINWET